VEVVEVVPGSIADKAGIEARDLIIAINDRVVANVDDVHRLLATIPITVSLEVSTMRNGRTRHVEIPAPGNLL
jgi:S1-C subfamily serine protease